MKEEFEHLNRNKKDLPVFPLNLGCKVWRKWFQFSFYFRGFGILRSTQCAVVWISQSKLEMFILPQHKPPKNYLESKNHAWKYWQTCVLTLQIKKKHTSPFSAEFYQVSNLGWKSQQGSQMQLSNRRVGAASMSQNIIRKFFREVPPGELLRKPHPEFPGRKPHWV